MHRGFGIGLATVQRIIQRHGSRIWPKGSAARARSFISPSRYRRILALQDNQGGGRYGSYLLLNERFHEPSNPDVVLE